MFSTTDVRIKSIADSDVYVSLVGYVIICFKSNILKTFSKSFLRHSSPKNISIEIEGHLFDVKMQTCRLFVVKGQALAMPCFYIVRLIVLFNSFNLFHKITSL